MGKFRTRAGVAAVAVASAVGAFAVPAIIGGAVANAAAPTALTASPSSQAIDTGGSADFKITVDNAGYTGGIYVVASSGPDAGALSYGNPQPCPASPPPTGSATCSITNGGGSGVDNLIFFYADGNNVKYTGQTPSTTGTLTVSGKLASASVSPSTAHQAQGMWQKYTANVSDVNGNAKANVPLTVKISETKVDNPNYLDVTDTDPSTTPPYFQGVQGQGTSTSSVTLPGGTSCAAQPCANGASVGQYVFWVESQVTGTVNIAVSTNDPTVGASASLTVDPGTVKDISQVVLSPAAQTTFQDVTVSTKATVENAQGDVVGDNGGGLPLAAKIISGPNKGNSTLAVSGYNASKPGVYTVTYHTNAPSANQTTTGQDDLQVWQQEANGTINKDPGEAFADALITVANRPTNITIHRVLPANSPVSTATSQTATQAVFEVDADVPGVGNQVPVSGYAVNFKVNNQNGNPPSLPASKVSSYSVSPSSQVSGNDGRVVVTITDPSPRLGDRVGVTASLAADPSQLDTVQVRYSTYKSQYTVAIQPYVNTSKIGGTASFTAGTTDGSGNAVSGISYIWQVTDENFNVIQNAAGATLSYTDARSSAADHVDYVSVTGYQNGNPIDGDSVNQYWVRDGQTGQLNGDLAPFNGQYTAQGVNPQQGPFSPSKFTKTANYAITSDPTATNPYSFAHVVGAMLADSNNNRLYGKQVTFTSSGVGTFTDANGKPIGTTITNRVDDQQAFFASENGLPENTDPDITDLASAFVRSSQVGTQTITITADGVSDTVLINWGGQYVPVTPVRVFDTRNGTGGAGGSFLQPGTPLHPNQLTGFDYSATPLPTNAVAYVFNVTAIHPDNIGNLRVAAFPANSATKPSTIPDTSLINYMPGKDVANSIVVGASGFGGLAVYSDNATVNVAVDFEGYYVGANSGYDPVSAPNNASTVRVADTRTGLGFAHSGDLAPGSPVSIQVTGPSQYAPTNGNSLKAVLVNVTAINPKGLGNLRIFADGVATPTASNINYIPGVDKAAFAIVQLPANGRIDVYSDGAATGVAVDVFGYLDYRNATVLQTPKRVLDTRSSSPIASGGTTSVTVVGGSSGVPANAQAVLVSVTAIHAAGSNGIGNLRVFPAGSSVPNSSTINYVSPTSDVANFAIVQVGQGGQISLYSDGTPINATVDVVGYVPAGS